MSENCTHDCSSCGESCPSRNGDAQPDFRAPMNAHSNVKHVIGVVSGKGGVGKSLVTSLMAATMRRRGRISPVLRSRRRSASMNSWLRMMKASSPP